MVFSMWNTHVMDIAEPLTTYTAFLTLHSQYCADATIKSSHQHINLQLTHTTRSVGQLGNKRRLTTALTLLILVLAMWDSAPLTGIGHNGVDFVVIPVIFMAQDDSFHPNRYNS